MTEDNKRGLKILAKQMNTTQEEVLNALVFNYRFCPERLPEILKFWRQNK